jgi:hypothetical protein
MMLGLIATATGGSIALAAIAAFLPLLLSFAAALRPGSKPEKAKHFFLYDGGLDTGKFVTGTVGYSMQVASIYLFFLWFQSYGAWSFTVPIAWFLGYVLLAWMVRRKWLDRFLEFQSDSVVTIHGYVAKEFGGRKWLPVALAITTICGLGGTMLGEIDYALTYFVFPSLTLAPPTGGKAVAVFVAVLMTSGCYIMWGGYKAAIDTDIFQVKFAYIFIGIVVGALSIGAAKLGNWPLALGITAFVSFYCWFAANRRANLQKIDSSYETSKLDRGIFYTLGIIVVVAVIFAFFLRGQGAGGISQGLAVFKPTTPLPWGFGIWGFIALMVTNGLWQLIDISALQRLQSLKFDPANPKERNKLSSGLIDAGLEGTGSWFLVLVLAILTKACGVDCTNILSALGGAWFLVPVFIYVVVAFMLSTLDTLIAASAYVFHYDGTRIFLPTSGRTEEVELRWARLGTLSCLSLVGLMYWGLRTYYSDDSAKLGTIVYAIYAIQASILGPVLVSIFAPQHRRNVWFSWVGLLGGWAVSYYTTVGRPTPLFGMPLDSWYLFPPFAAICVSVAISGLGCFFPAKKTNG